MLEHSDEPGLGLAAEDESYPEAEAGEVQDHEDGVLFYVNKDGFPIGPATWKRMWRYAARLHPEGNNVVNNLRGGKNLPEVCAQGVDLSSVTFLSSSVCVLHENAYIIILAGI